MEQVPKKKLSKGCLVGLIVAGALVVIAVVLVVLVFSKRDDVIKWGTRSAMQMVKAEIAKAPLTGVDTARFGALLDSFVARVNIAPMDYDKHSTFVPVLQKITADKKIDASEVSELRDAIVTYFPDLSSVSQGIVTISDSGRVAVPDTTKPADSSTSAK